MKKACSIAVLFIASILGSSTLAHAQAGSSPEVSTNPGSARQVAKEQRRADRKLATQVRRTLARFKGIDSTQIVVFAKQGAVTLTGSVPDASQITLAVDAARGVSGVISVDNALRIKAAAQ
ncbi:BON domain-containing protein [Burkholderia sp. Ac-20345]|uniref:BON domain-containing protein n=1 Tax=Burkholderia sp. Ac-20345 TaxID=2703891 RepID=UPI00197B57A6|nr:BON domain-containing protein [Burkholderia sp. Ac-20345]MBN3778650.1 BON domain-containing protein [Burkholderia sp. Ac-20345]